MSLTRRMTEQDPAIWDAVFAHMETADSIDLSQYDYTSVI